MKILFIPIILLALSGCVSSNPMLISNRAVITLPPDQLMTCPFPSLPNRFNNDNDVARTLVNLYGNNVKCSNNMTAVKSFLTQEKATIEAKERK